MKTCITILLFLIPATVVFSQETVTDSLPYASIPSYPETFSAGTVSSRMVDGLGFRFYWATEGLRSEDLAYRPGVEVRSIGETIDHIYAMAIMIDTAVHTNEEMSEEVLTTEEKRDKVLHLLKRVSNTLRSSSAEDMEGYVLKFGNGFELPFWNLINGPIADSIWHCGQIVSFRRAAGNPFNDKVSLLMGGLR